VRGHHGVLIVISGKSLNSNYRARGAERAEAVDRHTPARYRHNGTLCDAELTDHAARRMLGALLTFS